MKITKILAFALSILVVSGFLVFSASAASFPNLPSTPVTVTVAVGPGVYPLTIVLSDVPAGYDVTNGAYTGWCHDLLTGIKAFTPYSAVLISSLSQPTPWDKINYILNHKTGTPEDVQAAIWLIEGFTAAEILANAGFSPSATALALYSDANANGGGFFPGPGQIVAVIVNVEGGQDLLIELLVPGNFPKRFTSAFAINGFTAPTILDGGLNTSVVGLYSGPRIFWVVTYFFSNTEDFMGPQYDGEGHYFRLWDKWGGNLMVLDSQPTAFNPKTNIVTLANGESFDIKPGTGGYKDYVGTGLSFTDSNGNPATATLHTGDQQQGTNPGKGGGTTNDGSSYDMDLVWDIGYLSPGGNASLSIIVAPGKNPAGKLEFTKPGFRTINTGPRVRVYEDAAFTDFLYALDRTVQLGVIVTK
jgi:hypothetical protein